MIASGDRIKTMDIDTIYRLQPRQALTIGIRINTANITYTIAKPPEFVGNRADSFYTPKQRERKKEHCNRKRNIRNEHARLWKCKSKKLK